MPMAKLMQITENTKLQFIFLKTKQQITNFILNEMSLEFRDDDGK